MSNQPTENAKFCQLGQWLSNSQKSGPKTYDKQPNFGFWSDSFVEISKSFEPNCYSTVVHLHRRRHWKKYLQKNWQISCRVCNAEKWMLKDICHKIFVPNQFQYNRMNWRFGRASHVIITASTCSDQFSRNRNHAAVFQKSTSGKLIG